MKFAISILIAALIAAVVSGPAPADACHLFGHHAARRAHRRGCGGAAVVQQACATCAVQAVQSPVQGLVQAPAK